MSGKKSKGREVDVHESLRNVEGSENWTPTELANYFKTQGLGDYHEALVHHKITGRLAPLLKDSELKEMGINIVGDRLRFRQQIQSFGRKNRMLERTKVIWEGSERLYYGGCDACVSTCCGICPDDPSTYKLTSNHLKIKKVDPGRCGPIRLCCCNHYAINNIDLTHVNDVNVISRQAPCTQQVLCCARGKDEILINYAEGDTEIVLKQGDGEEVSHLILNQVEEAQVMERTGAATSS